MTDRPKGPKTLAYFNVKPGFPEWPQIHAAIARLAEQHGHGIDGFMFAWWPGYESAAKQVALMLEVASHVTSLGFEYAHGLKTFTYYQKRHDERASPLRVEFWVQAMNYLNVTSSVVAAYTKVDPMVFLDVEPSDPANPAGWIKAVDAQHNMSMLDYASQGAVIGDVVEFQRTIGYRSLLIFPGSCVAVRGYARIVGNLAEHVIHTPYGFLAAPDQMPLRPREGESKITYACVAQHISAAATIPKGQISYEQWRAIDWSMFPDLQWQVMYMNASAAADILNKIAAHHRGKSSDLQSVSSTSTAEVSP